MEKSIKIALIVGIIGTTIFVGLFGWREARVLIFLKNPSSDSFYRHIPSPMPTSSLPISNNITSQWETYRNSNYNINFKYPKEWGKLREWEELPMKARPMNLSLEKKAKEYKIYYTFLPQNKQIKIVWYHVPSKSLVFIKLGKTLKSFLGPVAQETLYIMKPDGKIVPIFTVPKDEVEIDCEIEFVDFSPNARYIVFNEYCYEASCARIVNVKTKQDILAKNHLSLADDSEVMPLNYEDIFWSPDSKTLAFRSYCSDFGGGSVGALYVSDYGNPEKINQVYKFSPEQHMGGSYFHDIKFINNKILIFSVYSRQCDAWPVPGESYKCSQPTDDRYEYDAVSKKLKEMKGYIPGL